MTVSYVTSKIMDETTATTTTTTMPLDKIDLKIISSLSIGFLIEI
jgi:hypothetical protein